MIILIMVLSVIMIMIPTMMITIKPTIRINGDTTTTNIIMVIRITITEQHISCLLISSYATHTKDKKKNLARERMIHFAYLILGLPLAQGLRRASFRLRLRVAQADTGQGARADVPGTEGHSRGEALPEFPARHPAAG